MYRIITIRIHTKRISNLHYPFLKIQLSNIRLLLCQKNFCCRFIKIPKILETPWLCAEGETKKTIPPYKEEIERLREK